MRSPPWRGKQVAEAAADEIRDEDGFDARAIARTAAPEGDLIVRGEITHVYGGNAAVHATILLCWFCGWWKGAAVVAVQGEVRRRDGTVAGVFSAEKLGSAWGETSSVAEAAKAAGSEIGEMVKDGEYRGGHPGNDGYLAPAKAAEPSAARLRELESLRTQGLISDAEFTEKRKQILREF